MWIDLTGCSLGLQNRCTGPAQLDLGPHAVRCRRCRLRGAPSPRSKRPQQCAVPELSNNRVPPRMHQGHLCIASALAAVLCCRCRCCCLLRRAWIQVQRSTAGVQQLLLLLPHTPVPASHNHTHVLTSSRAAADTGPFPSCASCPALSACRQHSTRCFVLSYVNHSSIACMLRFAQCCLLSSLFSVSCSRAPPSCLAHPAPNSCQLATMHSQTLHANRPQLAQCRRRMITSCKATAR